MADPAPAQQQNDARGGGNNQQQSLFQSLFRGIIFYFIFQNFIKGSPQKPGEQKGQPLPPIKPLMRKGDFLDMWLYINEERLPSDIFNATSLYHFEENIMLGEETDSSFMKHIEVELTQSLLNNGSLYAHVFFARSGKSPDKADPAYEEGASWGKTHNLIEYKAPMKVKTERNLITSEEEDVEVETNQVLGKSTDEKQVISFFKPNITINIVDDFSTYPGSGIPPQLKDHLVLEPSSGHYYPTIFMNDFWLLKENWVPINDTLTDPLGLTLQIAPISLLKWQMMMQMEESFRTQSEFGAMGDGDSDELKPVHPYPLSCASHISTTKPTCKTTPLLPEPHGPPELLCDCPAGALPLCL
ncbi:hypothetical protein CYMTET_27944 [Cymbomonas tetramitiformis]|uniref:Uncharacterized protein n=1 Tax=Cymbomonas tetramitiformis TaxID=36881 RepID=A0AAE0KWF5_9CHLO|nr:hypothetical protein CYMTET_27944 [Cymbomonas tetramitiformis]